MNLKFPIWVGGAAIVQCASNDNGGHLVAFSSAARAFAYFSAQAHGQSELKLVSAQRFQAMLPELYSQGGVELILDPEPDGCGGTRIEFSSIEDGWRAADDPA